MIFNAKNKSVVIDNTEMDYVSFGYGEKILIILPGLSEGLTSIKGKALLLAIYYKFFLKKFTVYIFSRKKDMPVDYSIEDMANDQAKAMINLNIKKAYVMGVSQGGMIGQYLAINHGELIDKLVIAVSAPCVNNEIQA